MYLKTWIAILAASLAILNTKAVPLTSDAGNNLSKKVSDILGGSEKLSKQANEKDDAPANARRDVNFENLDKDDDDANLEKRSFQEDDDDDDDLSMYRRSLEDDMLDEDDDDDDDDDLTDMGKRATADDDDDDDDDDDLTRMYRRELDDNDDDDDDDDMLWLNEDDDRYRRGLFDDNDIYEDDDDEHDDLEKREILNNDDDLDDDEDDEDDDIIDGIERNRRDISIDGKLAAFPALPEEIKRGAKPVEAKAPVVAPVSAPVKKAATDHVENDDDDEDDDYRRAAKEDEYADEDDDDEDDTARLRRQDDIYEDDDDDDDDDRFRREAWNDDDDDDDDDFDIDDLHEFLDSARNARALEDEDMDTDNDDIDDDDLAGVVRGSRSLDDLLASLEEPADDDVDIGKRDTATEEDKVDTEDNRQVRELPAEKSTNNEEMQSFETDQKYSPQSKEDERSRREVKASEATGNAKNNQYDYFDSKGQIEDDYFAKNLPDLKKTKQLPSHFVIDEKFDYTIIETGPKKKVVMKTYKTIPSAQQSQFHKHRRKKRFVNEQPASISRNRARDKLRRSKKMQLPSFNIPSTKHCRKICPETNITHNKDELLLDGQGKYFLIENLSAEGFSKYYCILKQQASSKMLKTTKRHYQDSAKGYKNKKYKVHEKQHKMVKRNYPSSASHSTTNTHWDNHSVKTEPGLKRQKRKHEKIPFENQLDSETLQEHFPDVVKEWPRKRLFRRKSRQAPVTQMPEYLRRGFESQARLDEDTRLHKIWLLQNPNYQQQQQQTTPDIQQEQQRLIEAQRQRDLQQQQQMLAEQRQGDLQRQQQERQLAEQRQHALLQQQQQQQHERKLEEQRQLELQQQLIQSQIGQTSTPVLGNIPYINPVDRPDYSPYQEPVRLPNPLTGWPRGPIALRLALERRFNKHFSPNPIDDVQWHEPTYLSNCWVQSMLSKIYSFSPNCNNDGTFAPKQCHLQRCWCVDKDGTPQMYGNSRFKYKIDGIMLLCVQHV